jgi:hypothetical protein
MKKALLAVIALLSFSAAEISAQCIPDLTMTSPGVVPDSATGLASAMVSQPYHDTLQFRTPTDTTVIYLGNPLFFTINYIRIDSVVGLPPGFSWSTSECGPCAPHTFNGGTNGCLLIYSISNPSATGTYPLKIKLTANGTNAIIGTISLPDSNMDYRIDILPLGVATINANVFEVFQNSPNPFSAQTEISFTAPSSAKADFRVYDMLGRELIHRNIDAVSGMNKITLSSRYLKPGIYFYKLNFKNKSVTRKMIVTARP